MLVSSTNSNGLRAGYVKLKITGDARGRVFSWSVAEQPGRGIADHWLKDDSADQCVGCHIRYY